MSGRGVHTDGDDDAHGGESGPQAERSRRLQTQALRMCPPVIYEPKTQTRSVTDTSTRPPPLVVGGPCAATASCHLQIAQLGDEKEFLTKYVERLLNQLRQVLQRHGELEKLKALSDPLGTSRAEAAGDAGETLERTPPWMTAVDYVNPLFQSYDLKIYELEHAVTENKNAMERIISRAESLAKENSTLRQELEATAEKLVLRMQHEPIDPHMLHDELLMPHDTSEYLSEINERINVLMSENNTLMEQVSLQDDELSGLKNEIADRDDQLQVMSQNFNQATLAIQELRDSCESIRDEKFQCEQQLQQYAVKLAQFENQKESIVAQMESLRTEKKNIETQVQEYERLLEIAKKNAEHKDETMSHRYQNVCSRLHELNSVIEFKQKRIDELEELNRGVNSELESVRQDCEGMLQVMNSMEKQLSQYCSREDAVAELEMECKAKIEDMMIEKEQIVARESQARREIARLLERIRTQGDEQLRGEEQRVHDVSRRYEQDLGSREEQIRDLRTELAEVRANLETSNRNQRDAEKRLLEVLKRADEAGQMFERKLRSLYERAASAEETRDAVTSREVDTLQTLHMKEEEVSKLRNDYKDRTQALNERITSLERELELRRSEAREAKEEADQKNHKIQLLNEQLNKVKADCANRFSSDFEVVYQENRELKSRAAELEYRLNKAKKEISSTVEGVKTERERAEVRLLAEIESLKGRLTSLKEEKGRVERCRQDAEAKHSMLNLQVQQLSRELTDTKEALHEREHACEDNDRKISELSAQLTMALSKQQQFYRQEREMRTAIERVTLEKTRLEREATLARKKLDEHRQADFMSLSHSYARPELRSSFSTPDKHSTSVDTTRKHGIYNIQR